MEPKFTPYLEMKAGESFSEFNARYQEKYLGLNTLLIPNGKVSNTCFEMANLYHNVCMDHFDGDYNALNDYLEWTQCIGDNNTIDVTVFNKDPNNVIETYTIDLGGDING